MCNHGRNEGQSFNQASIDFQGLLLALSQTLFKATHTIIDIDFNIWKPKSYYYMQWVKCQVSNVSGSWYIIGRKILAAIALSCLNQQLSLP